MDKKNLTQFGRGMKELGIKMIAAYAPEARGRSERMVSTLQGRLPQELKENGITEMEEANEFVKNKFLPDFNKRFRVEAKEEGEAFIPLFGAGIKDILCLKASRVVGNDNCVSYKNMRLQIPEVLYRNHFVRAQVQVHEYEDGSMGIYHAR